MIQELLNNYEILPDGSVYAKDRYVETKTGIRHYKRKRMKTELTSNGYERVVLCNAGKSKRYLVHRLVAMLYVPNPNNLDVVNHKDGNKRNNNADNLEWVTTSENLKHAFRIGLVSIDAVKEANSKAVAVYDLFGNVLSIYNSMTEAAHAYNISVAAVEYHCKTHCHPRKLNVMFRYI